MPSQLYMYRNHVIDYSYLSWEVFYLMSKANVKILLGSYPTSCIPNSALGFGIILRASEWVYWTDNRVYVWGYHISMWMITNLDVRDVIAVTKEDVITADFIINLRRHYYAYNNSENQ